MQRYVPYSEYYLDQIIGLVLRYIVIEGLFLKTLFISLHRFTTDATSTSCGGHKIVSSEDFVIIVKICCCIRDTKPQTSH